MRWHTLLSETLSSFSEQGLEQPQSAGKKFSKTTTVWSTPHWFSPSKKSAWCRNRERRPLTTRGGHQQHRSLQKAHLFRIAVPQPYMLRGLWPCWMQWPALTIQTLLHPFLHATRTVTDPCAELEVTYSQSLAILAGTLRARSLKYIREGSVWTPQMARRAKHRLLQFERLQAMDQARATNCSTVPGLKARKRGGTRKVSKQHEQKVIQPKPEHFRAAATGGINDNYLVPYSVTQD